MIEFPIETPSPPKTFSSLTFEVVVFQKIHIPVSTKLVANLVARGNF